MGWRRAAPEPEPEDYVLVPNVAEAVTSFHFELDGQPIYVTGPDSGRMGDVLHASDPIVRAHPHNFRPLRLRVGLRQRLLQEAAPAAYAPPEPFALTGERNLTPAERIQESWRSGER
jgi:hypothetical protein